MSDEVPDTPMLARIDQALDDAVRAGQADGLPPDLVRKMLTMGVRNYARCFEDDASVTPLDEDAVSATAVANTCLEMLRAANLELFELTFWGGRLSQDR